MSSLSDTRTSAAFPTSESPRLGPAHRLARLSFCALRSIEVRAAFGDSAQHSDWGQLRDWAMLDGAEPLRSLFEDELKAPDEEAQCPIEWRALALVGELRTPGKNCSGKSSGLTSGCCVWVGGEYPGHSTCQSTNSSFTGSRAG